MTDYCLEHCYDAENDWQRVILAERDEFHIWITLLSFTFDSHEPRNFRKKTSLTLIKTKIGRSEVERYIDRESERER